ncbi:MAG: hypothetical protein QM278_01285 [Pseudomonadota bacterium]|nr:hypothetical protein [Pseudomonadota bacterium]
MSTDANMYPTPQFRPGGYVCVFPNYAIVFHNSSAIDNNVAPQYGAWIDDRAGENLASRSHRCPGRDDSCRMDYSHWLKSLMYPEMEEALPSSIVANATYAQNKITHASQRHFINKLISSKHRYIEDIFPPLTLVLL